MLDRAIDWFRLRDGQYVPVEPDVLGESARHVLPVLRQLFLVDPAGTAGVALDRRIRLLGVRMGALSKCAEPFRTAPGQTLFELKNRS